MIPPEPLRFVDDYLPALLAQASHLISSEFHQVVNDNGFNVSEWRVLATLQDREPLSVGRVAQITLLKPSTVTRILDRMEADGYVQRLAAPNDRRVTPVRITEPGTQMVAKLVELARAHEQRVLEPFGLERAEALKETLRSIIALHEWGDPGTRKAP